MCVMPRKGEEHLFYIMLFSAMIIYVVFFSWLSILQYQSFFSFSSDSLAQSNNILWHTVSGRTFYNSIGEGILDSHPVFFYIFIAPIYKLFPHIFTLFILVHGILALGIFPIYWISREKFNSEFIAIVYSFTYLLFNPLHHLSFVSHKPLISFSTTFILFIFYYFYKKHMMKFIIFSILAMMCRDEVGFLICIFAVLAFVKKMPLRWKIIPILLGGGYVYIVWNIIMPSLGRLSHSNPYIWNLFGENPQKYSFMQLLFYRREEIINKLFAFSNFQLLIKLFDPKIFFVSLFAPEVLLLGLPVLASVQVAQEKYFLTLDSFHHIAYLVPLIFLGAIFGICRIVALLYNKNILPRRITLKILFFIFGSQFLIWTLFSNFGDNIIFSPSGIYRDEKIADERFVFVRNMYNPIFYRQDEKDKMAWEFIRLIPSNVSV